jgi:hypothetical protein
MLLRMEFALRAKAEGVSITVKTLLVYALVYRGWGLLAYATAQLAYSCVLLTVYTLLHKSGDNTFSEIFDQNYRF